MAAMFALLTVLVRSVAKQEAVASFVLQQVLTTGLPGHVELVPIEVVVATSICMKTVLEVTYVTRPKMLRMSVAANVMSVEPV
jgi:hypothetical protein